MDLKERLARSLVEQAIAQAGGKPVLAVHLALAKCSALHPNELRYYWDMAAKDTVCQGARLEVRQVAFLQECPSCGHRFAAKDQHARCPNCRAEHTATLVGDDCALVEKVEVYHTAPTEA